MTQEEIIEGNKTIAEFMDMQNNPFPPEVDELRYHTSWDWLMPVVEKISEVAAGGITYDIHQTLAVANMEKSYKSIIEFIEWYNNRYK